MEIKKIKKIHKKYNNVFYEIDERIKIIFIYIYIFIYKIKYC